MRKRGLYFYGAVKKMAQTCNISAPCWGWEDWGSLWMCHKRINLCLHMGVFLCCVYPDVNCHSGPQLQQPKPPLPPPFTGHIKTDSVFSTSKGTVWMLSTLKKKKKRTYVPCRFGFQGVKQRPAGFFAIVISSCSPRLDWVHAGTNGSDSVAMSRAKSPRLSQLTCPLLDMNWEGFISGHSNNGWQRNKGSEIARTLCILYLRCDAASIWTYRPASRAVWAIPPHKCCRGSCWLSDSDQYACYQDQGMNGTVICPGRTISSQQLFRSQLALYWLMKLLAVKLSKGRQLSLIYLETWLTAILLLQERERDGGGETRATEKMKPLPVYWLALSKRGKRANEKRLISNLVL